MSWSRVSSPATRSSSVREIAKILLEHRISALPIMDDQGKLVGIVSEADLLHGSESGTGRHRAWWLKGPIGDETHAHGIREGARLQSWQRHDDQFDNSDARDAAPRDCHFA